MFYFAVFEEVWACDDRDCLSQRICLVARDMLLADLMVQPKISPEIAA